MIGTTLEDRKKHLHLLFFLSGSANYKFHRGSENVRSQCQTTAFMSYCKFCTFVDDLTRSQV